MNKVLLAVLGVVVVGAVVGLAVWLGGDGGRLPPISSAEAGFQEDLFAYLPADALMVWYADAPTAYAQFDAMATKTQTPDAAARVKAFAEAMRKHDAREPQVLAKLLELGHEASKNARFGMAVTALDLTAPREPFPEMVFVASPETDLKDFWENQVRTIIEAESRQPFTERTIAGRQAWVIEAGRRYDSASGQSTPIEFAYTWDNGHFVGAVPAEALEKCFAEGPRFGDAEGLEAVRGVLEEQGVMKMAMNAGQYMKVFLPMIEREMMGQHMAMPAASLMGLKWLRGLGDEPMWAAANVDMSDGLRLVAASAAPEELMKELPSWRRLRTGQSSLFAYLPEDCHAAAMVRFGDLNEYLDFLRTQFGQADPAMAREMDTFIEQAKQEGGIDIPALLASVGDEVAVGARLSPEMLQPGPGPKMPDFLVLLDVRGTELLETITKLPPVTQGFRTEEIAGVKVWVPQQPGLPVAFCQKGNTLMAGTLGMLKPALEGGAKTFLDSDAYRTATAQVPVSGQVMRVVVSPDIWTFAAQASGATVGSPEADALRRIGTVTLASSMRGNVSRMELWAEKLPQLIQMLLDEGLKEVTPGQGSKLF